VKIRLIFSSIMAATLVGCSAGGGATPTDAVEQVMRRLDIGACASLGDYFVESKSNERDLYRVPTRHEIELTCTSDFEERRKQKPENQRRLKQVNILNQQEDGDRATVRFEVEFNDGPKLPGAFILLRQDNRWRIDLAATQDLNNRMMSSMPDPSLPPPELTAPPAAPPAQPQPAQPSPPQPK
jgi:hypothetical protein